MTVQSNSQWEDYKRQFLVHLDAKSLYDANGRRKVDQLLKFMGPRHVLTYDSFSWEPGVEAVAADEANGIAAVAAIPAESKHDLDTVFQKFDTFFGVHKYRSIKRQEFLRAKRDVPTQSIVLYF